MTNGDEIRFTLRVPFETMKKIELSAEKIGMSKNSLIVKILWDWVNKNKQV